MNCINHEKISDDSNRQKTRNNQEILYDHQLLQFNLKPEK